MMGGSRSSTSAWLLSLKAVAASATVVSTAVALRLAAPPVVGFVASEVPKMYSSLLAWLAPPYIYFVINGIILSIAASSRFQKPHAASAPPPVVANPVAMPPPEEYGPIPAEYDTKIEEGVRSEFVVAPSTDLIVTAEEEVAKAVEGDGEGEEEEEAFVISRSSWSPKRRDATEIPTEYSALTEKPLVSVRLGHRKAAKPSPEGKALRVARPRRNETLESTWRTITEGRAVPLARHLKKSDTWETHGRRAEQQSPAPALVRKSETFNDRAGPSPGGGSSSSGGRLRREPSLGQDELNRRVEAFIKKFNEEMRLQRQESFRQYMEMINSGAH